MGKRVVILEEAEFELVAAVRWYEAQRLGLGAEFRQRVDETMQRLTEPLMAATPVAGVRVAMGAKKVFVERFPYAVVFIHRGNRGRLGSCIRPSPPPTGLLA